jgi:primary-amine oxidase
MQTAFIQHPLEPLTSQEICAAVEIVRTEPSVGPQFRFPCVTLSEPEKSTLLAFEPGDFIPRAAFMILLDTATGYTYEAVVNLTQKVVTSWQHIPQVQPNIMADELAECEIVVKEHPHFRAAIARRGIPNLDLVVVDPWAIGHFGFESETGIRLSRCLCYLRSVAHGNFYSRPIDGLVPVVDLNKMEVLQVEDAGSIPVPSEPGEYAKSFIPKFRDDIKPLHITQPEGPSFQVKGHQVRWQKWQFRIGFTPREGVVLYTVGYEDEGHEGQQKKLRSILYRASMSEMVVPYGDPRSQHFRKNAFDLGEHGIGMLANALTLGCDCVGEI